MRRPEKFEDIDPDLWNEQEIVVIHKEFIAHDLGLGALLLQVMDHAQTHGSLVSDDGYIFAVKIPLSEDSKARILGDEQRKWDVYQTQFLRFINRSEGIIYPSLVRIGATNADHVFTDEEESRLETLVRERASGA